MRIGTFDSSPLAAYTLDIEVAALPTAATLAPDRHPAAVYIASLSQGSRRTMMLALRTVATMIDPAANMTSIPWDQLDYAHIAAIRSRLAERYSPATGNRILSALRGVIKCSFKLGLINSDKMARACGVEPIRGSRVMKGRALSSGELRALFDACVASTPAGARNAALLGLLYGSGLRRSEAVALDIEHFEPATSKLLIHGKGNKQRTVFVTNGAREALDAWLEHRGQDPGPLLMPVIKGGHIARRRMTDQAVFELVRRLAVKASVARFPPHDLRRSMIGDSLDAGADLISLQGLVGHASPTTVARYDRRGERARRKAAELIHVPFVRPVQEAT